jgi:uncharacterized protein
LPLSAGGGGVRVTVRLAPRARAERIDGIARLADGTPALKVSVTAPPEDGRANEALLRLLAREWRLPRRDLAIVAGARSRDKTVHVAGDTGMLLARLAAALAGPDKTS